jgi:hypothetical protein
MNLIGYKTTTGDDQAIDIVPVTGYQSSTTSPARWGVISSVLKAAASDRTTMPAI